MNDLNATDQAVASVIANAGTYDRWEVAVPLAGRRRGGPQAAPTGAVHDDAAREPEHAPAAEQQICAWCLTSRRQPPRVQVQPRVRRLLRHTTTHTTALALAARPRWFKAADVDLDGRVTGADAVA